MAKDALSNVVHAMNNYNYATKKSSILYGTRDIRADSYEVVMKDLARRQSYTLE
jgi:hypothetical protein